MGSLVAQNIIHASLCHVTSVGAGGDRWVEQVGGTGGGQGNMGTGRQAGQVRNSAEMGETGRQVGQVRNSAEMRGTGEQDRWWTGGWDIQTHLLPREKRLFSS